MFRKPREAVGPAVTETSLKPSTGRPPTPPMSISQPKPQSSTGSMMTIASSTTLLTGRTKALPKNNARTPTFAGKAKGKPNGSILNFFKKAESALPHNVYIKEDEDSLFLDDSPIKRGVEMPVQTPTPPRDYDPPESPSGRLCHMISDHEEIRFNEDYGPVKRRRVEGPPSPSIKTEAAPKTGPFVEDSESDDEMVEQMSKSLANKSGDQGDQPSITPKPGVGMGEQPWAVKSSNSPPVPSLRRESTSIVDRDEFEGIEDCVDDEFPEEGEEFLERQWMEEQLDLELGLEENEDLENDMEGKTYPLGTAKDDIQDSGAASCPICSGSFASLTDQVRRKHSLRTLYLTIL